MHEKYMIPYKKTKIIYLKKINNIKMFFLRNCSVLSEIFFNIISISIV